MNLPKILQRLDYERRHFCYSHESLTRLPHLTRLRSDSQYSIPYSRLTPETADAAITHEIAHHRHLNTPFEWKLYTHDTPPNLLDLLARRSFTIGPQESVLIYDLSTPPPWPSLHPTTRIDHPSQIPTFKYLAEEIFQKDYTFTSTQLTAALSSNSTEHRAYLSYSGPHPAAIARLYTHPNSHFAGLFGAGTLPAHRHQGLYRSLLAARAQDALASGCRYLLVDALPTSRPILEKLGFQPLTQTHPCQWRP